MGLTSIAALSTLLLAQQLAAQQQLSSIPQQQPAPPQTFRSGTEIVEVDVRVTKDNRFVTNLGRDDFELVEDGAPQKIQSLVLIQGASGATGAAGAGGAGAQGAEGAKGAPTAKQVWLFLFDTTHLSPGGLTRTRDAVVKFIAEKFREGDVGGVVADGKMANNRLTSVREELRAAAAAVKMPGNTKSHQLDLREWPRLQDDDEAWLIATGNREDLNTAIVRACSEDPDACRRAPPEAQVREKARRLTDESRRRTALTLRVADALSNGLARIPGSKTVVFLSEGFGIHDEEADLQQAVGLAARAGARFYAIDARGLNRGSASSEIIDQPVASSTVGGRPYVDTNSDAPNSLSVDTGGFAIRNENNFGRALDEIQADAGTYYVLGYAPTNPAFDGKYRTISVKVKRDGVKVRARRGYLALPAAALVQPTPTPPLVGGVVPPKLPGDSPAAKADIIPPKPAGDPEPAKADDPTVPLLRPHVDAGKMVLALGKDATASTAAERGWEAYEKGDVETAARDLGEAATAADARPWIVYALGLSQFALRQYDSAARSWERVRRDAPEFEPIYFSLADAYSLQHDEGTAIKVLREAERRWPADGEVSNAIGVIQVRRGALDAAIESFERATKTAPAEALGYFNLARAHQMRLMKSQRYDRQMEKWIGGDEDRRRATANFQKYLELGGPYEQQAREALASLAWK